jgi:hypothetical protein
MHICAYTFKFVCVYFYLYLYPLNKHTHTTLPWHMHTCDIHARVCIRAYIKKTHIRTFVVIITNMRAYSMHSMQICIRIHTPAVEHVIALSDLKHIKAPSKHDQNTCIVHTMNSCYSGILWRASKQAIFFLSRTGLCVGYTNKKLQCVANPKS